MRGRGILIRISQQLTHAQWSPIQVARRNRPVPHAFSTGVQHELESVTDATGLGFGLTRPVPILPAAPDCTPAAGGSPFDKSRRSTPNWSWAEVSRSASTARPAIALCSGTHVTDGLSQGDPATNQQVPNQHQTDRRRTKQQTLGPPQSFKAGRECPIPGCTSEERQRNALSLETEAPWIITGASSSSIRPGWSPNARAGDEIRPTLLMSFKRGHHVGIEYAAVLVCCLQIIGDPLFRAFLPSEQAGELCGRRECDDWVARTLPSTFG